MADTAPKVLSPEAAAKAALATRESELNREVAAMQLAKVAALAQMEKDLAAKEAELRSLRAECIEAGVFGSWYHAVMRGS